jgi:hypothetical protein
MCTDFRPGRARPRRNRRRACTAGGAVRARQIEERLRVGLRSRRAARCRSCGCQARGSTRPRFARAAPKRPETCSSGTACLRVQSKSAPPACRAAVQPVVKSFGCRVAQQARQGEGRAHVAEGIVGLAVLDAVGRGEVLEAESSAGRPRAAATRCPRAQRVGGAHGVDEVPARAPVAVLAGVGVAQIAIQGEARDLVVEAQGVVAHAQVPGRASSAWTAAMNSASMTPRSCASWGVIPVTRQASGWGR